MWSTSSECTGCPAPLTIIWTFWKVTFLVQSCKNLVLFITYGNFQKFSRLLHPEMWKITVNTTSCNMNLNNHVFEFHVIVCFFSVLNYLRCVTFFNPIMNFMDTLPLPRCLHSILYKPWYFLTSDQSWPTDPVRWLQTLHSKSVISLFFKPQNAKSQFPIPSLYFAPFDG